MSLEANQQSSVLEAQQTINDMNARLETLRRMYNNHEISYEDLDSAEQSATLWRNYHVRQRELAEDRQTGRRVPFRIKLGRAVSKIFVR